MSKGTFLYVGGFELPDKNAAAHRVLTNAKMLRDIGYKVVFLGVNKTITSKLLKSKVEDFETYSIAYPCSLNQWVKYLYSIDAVEDLINQYSDVEAIICYNYQSVALSKLIKVGKKKNLKIIADCTEWYGAQGKNVFMKAIKGVDSFFRMRILQKKVDGLVVISRYLRNYYNNHKNLIELPPLVDLTEEKWLNSIERIDYKQHIKLVYSGSPGFKKDKINKIINGLYILRDRYKFIFIVIGITEKDYLSYYPGDKMKITELNNKVKFLGRLSHQESITILKQGDFSIFIREDNLINRAGFPTKLVESMSCGVPVITNKTSNIDEYISNGNNGFLIDDDIINGLENVFKLDKSELEQIKNNVDKEIFYFVKYIDTFKEFLEDVFGERL